MSSPLESGVVHLWDLKDCNIYLDLRKKFKLDLIINARDKAGSWEKLSNYIRASKSSLRHFLGYHKISLQTIFSLSKFLSDRKFSLTNIEKQVTRMSCKNSGGSKSAGQIINPKLPFRLNNQHGARIIAAFLFDGGINYRDLKPHYWNEDFNMRKAVYLSVNKIFGKITTNKKALQNPVMFPKVIGLILHNCFNMPRGTKVLLKYNIPDIIFTLKKQAKSIFLRQAFDDEGSICFIRTHRVISLSQATDITSNLGQINVIVPKTLIGIRRLLSELGIESNPPYLETKYYVIRAGKRYTRGIWRITITNRNNLIRFYNKVNFSINYKRINLRKAINSYKKVQYPHFKIYNLAMNKIKLLQEEGKLITKFILSRSLKRSSDWSWAILKKFEDSGFIVKVYSGNCRWSGCNKYILNETRS